ncbi:MAG: pyruvate, phosphate dikinase [candidate division Zixibacteria bacterium]|nr:pyruvate, phosphate dikinase [candidate division Zixibacteria bacterium]
MKDLLGGKGANLAEMTNLGVPVPPGFTITTEACNLFYENDLRSPKWIDDEVRRYIVKLEREMGKKFGHTDDPLLVSVRSGAKFSMPGMMDTILNLGLNDQTVKGLAKKAKNERFAHDCYRRFISMFGSVVLGIEKSEFEHIVTKKKEQRQIKQDSSLITDDWKDIIQKFKALVKKKSGEDFPSDPYQQLFLARDAVFKSWNNPRAIEYRRLYNIPSHIGTAVTVQTMVFGNLGETSATGVGFTRNPSTGENHFYGEFLVNAQGEDVVAGIRTPQPIKEMEKKLPAVFKQLKAITAKLEHHYKDLQDFEFTVQEGKLFMLQTRIGKRTTQAAVKIAVDLVKEKLLTKEEALLRIDPEDLNQLLHPRLDPKAEIRVITKGLAASPGAASGRVVFSAEEAVRMAQKNEKVILVRQETNPDDIHGMVVAQGVLTSRGGMTSHAAVVARGMGKPCVAGAEQMKVNEEKRFFSVGSLVVRGLEIITINGSTGEVILGAVPTVTAELSGEFAEFMGWADKIRKLKVRTNADTPPDAEVAYKFGAEGIGLCRTEHMFFAPERVPLVQEMIMAENREERKRALDKLLPFQKADFKGIFLAMRGSPVTIRTLDPPLHEFLPKREVLLVELTELKAKNGDPIKIAEKERLLKRVEELAEFNPMLGHRGCRLGITFPEITEMQAKAIFEAALEAAKDGVEVHPEIMIPLVGFPSEFKHQKEIVVNVANEVLAKSKSKYKVKYLIGTMIEVPRAALVADQIAEEAEFFSFGTNDLTQLTLGFSRDDAGKFLKDYQEKGILSKDPFVHLETEGVGAAIKMAIEKGKKTRKDMKVGICGEHGGDPESIAFCHEIGLDYVSCSPYRVPIARLAAAHSVLGQATAASK